MSVNISPWDLAIIVVYLVGNILRRRRAERDLRKVRNYITNIINSMPSALVSVDADGKVTQWNTGAQKIAQISSLFSGGDVAHPGNRLSPHAKTR